jgi:hypothetical protein
MATALDRRRLEFIRPGDELVVTAHFIMDVEVIMSEVAALIGEDAVVRVLRGIFRHADAEG